jgi:uncharacterized protein YkwD
MTRIGKHGRKWLHASSHHLLSTIGFSLCALLILASFAFTAFIAAPGLISSQLAAVVTAKLVALTNDDRSDNGLGTLTVSPALTAAAQAKANDMAAKGYFAHVSPDGRDSWSWFKDAGYSFSYAGENLAVDFTDSGDVNQAWLNSPTHRANIMNGHFTQIGIATAEGEFEGHKTVFVVQMFGTPAVSDMPTKVVTTASPKDASEPALAEARPEADVLGSSAGPETHAAPPAEAAISSNDAAGPVANEAPAQENAAPAGTSASHSLLSSPHGLLRGIYIFLALLLLLALAVRTRLEFKLHHVRHVAFVFVLILMMGSCTVIADHYIFAPPVIGVGVMQ